MDVDEDVDSRSGWRLRLEAPPAQSSKPQGDSNQSEANTDSLNKTPPSVVLNYAYVVRRLNDGYGRDITLLRKSLTDDDTKPFETA